MRTEALALALTFAVVLDLLLGDPLWLPHPVRWMGRAIEILEPRFRRLALSPLFFSGALMAAGLVLAVWIGCLLIVALAAGLHPVAAIVVQTLMLYTCISARGLWDAALAVARALSEEGLAAGRRAVSMIVGRETDRLDETGVTRAAVETVAENLVDGFVSPLFFLVLGGAPLAMAYKMINTLDSMVGYKKRPLPALRPFCRPVGRRSELPARPPQHPVYRFGRPVDLQDGTKRPGCRPARRARPCQSQRRLSPRPPLPGRWDCGWGGPNFYHGRLVDKTGHRQRSCRSPAGSYPSGLPADGGHGPAVFHGRRGGGFCCWQAYRKLPWPRKHPNKPFPPIDHRLQGPVSLSPSPAPPLSIRPDTRKMCVAWPPLWTRFNCSFSKASPEAFPRRR